MDAAGKIVTAKMKNPNMGYAKTVKTGEEPNIMPITKKPVRDSWIDTTMAKVKKLLMGRKKKQTVVAEER